MTFIFLSTNSLNHRESHRNYDTPDTAVLENFSKSHVVERLTGEMFAVDNGSVNGYQLARYPDQL